MARHLHLVPTAPDLVDEQAPAATIEETNVIDLDTERMRRRYRFHPSAGPGWLDDLFDDDLDPVC